MSRRELRGYRSVDVAMIFQDPQAHVNPVRTIGDFLTEALRTNRGMSASVARERVIGLLSDVWVDDASRRMRQYPHEVSGGMLQRVMIAAALAIEPRLLIADEPTTGLDVTTQAEVMAILDEQRQQRGLAMLFITHDLDLAASVCDRTTVMYAGSTVETNATAEVYEAPLHPYTAALLAARPDIGVKTRPVTIPGRPLSGPEAPSGCAFRDRCPYAQSLCSAEPLELVASDGGLVRCHRFRDLRFSLRELAHRHGGRA
jgi:oligopeptide/dipeptide ABC transporter ATP-binding protein